MRHLKLGVIGMSEGNGHPYSWSAIINGYEPAAMAECPFPAIPAYLAERRFPEDQLGGAQVTHVWTQDRALTAHIARASHVPFAVGDYREMVGAIDALLLARDDAENHRTFAEPFLRARVPVYLDKPPALSISDLDAIYALAARPDQIFSCSALRFAEELRLTEGDAERIGSIVRVLGTTPKSWARYSAHVIDPIVSFLRPGKVDESHVEAHGESVSLSVRWEGGRTGLIEATGETGGEISLTYIGERGSVRKVFRDSFSAFREALRRFLLGVRRGGSEIAYSHLRGLVELIELGSRSAPRANV